MVPPTSGIHRFSAGVSAIGLSVLPFRSDAVQSHSAYFIVGMLRLTASRCSGQRAVITLVRV